MERDFKNVYDLSVSQNLESTAPVFAAKLSDLAEPCSVDEFRGPGDGGKEDFTGNFLETGVSCNLVGVDASKTKGNDDGSLEIDLAALSDYLLACCCFSRTKENDDGSLEIDLAALSGYLLACCCG